MQCPQIDDGLALPTTTIHSQSMSLASLTGRMQLTCTVMDFSQFSGAPWKSTEKGGCGTNLCRKKSSTTILTGETSGRPWATLIFYPIARDTPWDTPNGSKPIHPVVNQLASGHYATWGPLSDRTARPAWDACLYAMCHRRMLLARAGRLPAQTLHAGPSWKLDFGRSGGGLFVRRVIGTAYKGTSESPGGRHMVTPTPRCHRPVRRRAPLANTPRHNR